MRFLAELTPYEYEHSSDAEPFSESGRKSAPRGEVFPSTAKSSRRKEMRSERLSSKRSSFRKSNYSLNLSKGGIVTLSFRIVTMRASSRESSFRSSIVL